MKHGKTILKIILITCLLSFSSTSFLQSAGTFDFNDGTTQGWTLDQMYVTATQTKFTPVIGFTLVNSDNQLAALTGSLLIGRSDQNDIYLESPDLSSNSNWQGIGGYSIDVKRLLYTPCWGDFPNVFFVQFQLKVIDTADGNKEKLFAEHDGTNFIFHDIKNYNQLYHFTWKPSWLADPRYKVKKIRIRITGPGDQMPECWLRGSWNIDNVISEAGTGSYNTNPGTNVQVNLGSGVTTTFDNVTGAGNTSLTTSSSGTPPPGGLAVLPVGSPTYYSITTAATFTGNIKICITYNDAGLTAQQEASLALYVYEMPPGQWKNITTSVDNNANIICGVVTHLSEFSIMFSIGGATEWVLTNQPTSGTITCFTVTGIGIFAGTEAGGVLLSTDNGGSWNPVNTGLTKLTVRALCSNGAYIFAGTWGNGVFRTNNSTTINWTPVNTGLSTMAVSSLYTSGSNLIAGTWGGGVFLSTNNGSSWTPINNGITQTCVRSLYISGTHFFAGTINGLFHSTNSGASWTAMNTGLTNTAAISLAGMPIGSMDKLFAGTDGGGVFLDTPATNWTAINSGLSNLHIPYLCVHLSNLFAATWGGGVFLNQDPTAAWSAVNDGLTNLYIRTLITSGSYIFAGTNNGGIWRRILADLIPDVPDIASDPMSWNYGSVVVGNSSDKTFVIKNEGRADLNVTGSSLTGANALEFSIQTSGGAYTLAPGASRDMMIKFAPTGTGSKSATLNINSNDPDENPLLVALTGTGSSTPTCSITVTSPNGGESVGCSKTITWTSSNASGNVKIEYYCNDTWHTIISTTPNDGSYTWTVPNNTVCSSKIKISDVAATGCWDMSDNYFNINCTTSCSFTITAPNGGENIGCSTTITWTSSGASGNVKLEYYCGTTWNTIIASTPNDGSYAWTIPAGTVCSSKIKVSDIANTGCWDMSNDYFNINCQATTCQITVTSPNGGETVGCSHTIRWTSAHASGNVKIEYQCNSVWNVIVNSTPNDGTYDWTIPAGTNCATARVRITDAVTAACTDQSNSNFTISCGGVGPCNPPFIKAEPVEGAAGMDIQVPIHMKGNTTPVDAFGFEFRFCTDKLHLLEVIKGPLTVAFSFFQFQETSPGTITIGGFHTTAIPANADGLIAYVRLHVDACTSGEMCILYIDDLVDDLAGMSPCNGAFTCGTPCKLGDVNNDGSLTPGDALCAFQIYLNGGTPPAGTSCDNDCALSAADVNCTPDGITPGDALYIFQGYLGGMTPPIACKPAALPKESDEINVTITSAEGKPGDEVVFTIELDRPESIQAFGIDLGYPAELLTFAGIRPSGMTTGWEVLDGRVNIDGVVTIGGFNPVVPETHNSVGLVDVVFRIHEDADGFGELWLFNFTDDLAQASSRSGRFGTSMEGVRRLGGLEVPSNYHLEQNYPNPFNMDTEIMYQLPEAGYVSVTVYNSVGHQIRSLVSEHHEAGRYAARWDGMDDQGNDIPSGVYIYQIKTGKFSDSKKMILIK